MTGGWKAMRVRGGGGAHSDNRIGRADPTRHPRQGQNGVGGGRWPRPVAVVRPVAGAWGCISSLIVAHPTRGASRGARPLPIAQRDERCPPSGVGKPGARRPSVVLPSALPITVAMIATHCTKHRTPAHTREPRVLTQQSTVQDEGGPKAAVSLARTVAASAAAARNGVQSSAAAQRPAIMVMIASQRIHTVHHSTLRTAERGGSLEIS